MKAMAYFAPTRASTPPRPPSFASTPTVAHHSTAVSDISRSSAVSTSELASLTPNEIEFIDAVISRASPSATTFLSIFKAYNDVLHERGLDPQNEVVYYGKLLKLGTLKGQNWGDKWNAVKLQHGYVANSTAPSRAGATGRASRPIVKQSRPAQEAVTTNDPAARLLMRLRTLQHGNTPKALETYPPDDTEMTPTEVTDETELDVHHHHVPSQLHRRRQPSPSQMTATTSNSVDIGKFSAPQPVPIRPMRHVSRWPSRDSETIDAAESISTTPPSYKTTARDVKSSIAVPKVAPARAKSQIETYAPSSRIAPVDPPRAQPKRASVIDEDNAWNKIKMAQDEREADLFREERLVERCWEVWKQGLDWIITTSEQIAQARDTLILRLTVQKWHMRLLALRDLDQRVQTLSDKKCLKAALTVWQNKHMLKKQAMWRDEMRNKMKLIREKRESKLQKDAWAKWRQLYQSHLSRQHYTERLVLRLFNLWKQKLARIDGLEGKIDGYVKTREKSVVARSWDMWRRAADLKNLEAALAARVSTQIARDALGKWKQQMQKLRTADAFYDVLVQKSAMRRWKASQNRIRALERRADKHVARQEDILVRAVARVWKARERGQLLERVKITRSLKQAWAVWTKQLQRQKELEDQAIAFSTRTNSSTAVSALTVWKQRLMSHHNSAAFAAQYHTAQLQFRTMFTWRLQLRAMLKLQRQARLAEKFFVMRKAWKAWMQKRDEQRREKMLKEYERQKAKRMFQDWSQLAFRRRHHRLAEEELRSRITTRTLSGVLSRWTNRVIEIKLRELEVAQSNDRALVTTAFKKWKGVCIRHVEELSLMESYQDVKREENMRRMFYKWLAAARTARNRRVVLQENEKEMQRYRLAAAWDKWRGRFQGERLRPIERTFLLQNQNALLYRTFVTWHSKTKSLPAVRFHATYTKARFWRVWRAAMPRALQAKEAREKDKKTVLAKAFEKWVQAHRTKIALRAVARARYMRLPTAAPRQSVQPALPRSLAPPSSSRPSFPRKPAPGADPEVTDTDADADTEVEVPRPASPIQPRPKHVGARAGIASLLSSSARTGRNAERSPTRPRFSARSTGARDSSPGRSVGATRDPSPTRTAPISASGERGSLWTELREIRRRSRTPTVRGRSPSPLSP